MAGNDAGGIATYAAAGADWKYSFVWLMVAITVSLVIVQEMCARMGAVTGQGLIDLVREKFGIGWTLVALAAVLVANGGTIVTEFAGVAAALGLFGISKYISVPVGAVALWFLVLRSDHRQVERVLSALSFVFIVYIPAAILAHPDWGEVSHSVIHPAFYWHTPGFLLAFVAVVGTTITPYMQLTQQSLVADEGLRVQDYAVKQKWNTVVSCIFANLISIFIIVATASALFHTPGSGHVDTAQAAARALQPVLGKAAVTLFAVGLCSASLLAGVVLPFSTARSLCEGFGFPARLDDRFQDAPQFYAIFTGLLVLGAAVALVSWIDPIQLMVYVQAIEGCILPVFLVFIMLIINDPESMPELRNGRLFNALAWITTLIISLVAVGYVVLQNILPLFGIRIA